MTSKLAAAAIIALSAQAALAAPTLVVPGGRSLDPFGGIDWSANGTAFTTGFDQAAANAGREFSYTTTFFAYATPDSGIQSPAGLSYIVPDLVGGAQTGALPGSPFELTTVATFNETGRCAVGGASCDFTITGGRFDVYLDISPNARTGAAASLGQYQDGARIIGGRVDSGMSNFNLTPDAGGTGSQSVLGTVEFTNAAYLSPNLVGTSATGTLQIGTARTNYMAPGFCSSTGMGMDVRGCLAFQTDANQSFSFAGDNPRNPVPVPGTLLLLGSVLAGVALTRIARASH